MYNAAVDRLRLLFRGDYRFRPEEYDDIAEVG